MNIESFIRKQPRALLIFIGLLLIAAAAVTDHITGDNLSFLLFYLIPVYFFVWFVTRRIGIVASVPSG